ncbi:hypothetical protein BJ085DRAFT_39575, partial [Dimargaris cristalligena]
MPLGRYSSLFASVRLLRATSTVFQPASTTRYPPFSLTTRLVRQIPLISAPVSTLLPSITTTTNPFRSLTTTSTAQAPHRINMLDFFKNEIAQTLAGFSGLEPQVIFNAIDTPKVADHGDLAVAVPRLRLPGKPVEIAKDWVARFEPTEYVT